MLYPCEKIEKFDTARKNGFQAMFRAAEEALKNNFKYIVDVQIEDGTFRQTFYTFSINEKTKGSTYTREFVLFDNNTYLETMDKIAEEFSDKIGQPILIKGMSLQELVELKETIAKEIITRHCDDWKKEVESGKRRDN